MVPTLWRDEQCKSVCLKTFDCQKLLSRQKKSAKEGLRKSVNSKSNQIRSSLDEGHLKNDTKKPRNTSNYENVIYLLILWILWIL
jgi:hypothetical protein